FTRGLHSERRARRVRGGARAVHVSLSAAREASGPARRRRGLTASERDVAMKTLKSYARGAWHQAAAGFSTLVDPSTEEPIAQASSAGLDFAGMLAYARELGGPALRALTFAERGEMLRAMSKALRDHRGELLELSTRN